MVALMKPEDAKPRHPALQKLVEQLTNSSQRYDPQTIDALYDLEPVYEPGGPQVSGTATSGHEPTEFVTISCPYCGESYETQIDLTGGSFSYVEDCQVCCQPIELSVVVGDAQELVSFTAQRMD